MPVAEDEISKAFIVKAGEGRTVHVMGEDLTIKISSRDTDGAFTVFEGRARPLQGPPLHCHLEQDEWWHIVEGEYLFEVDGQEIRAGAGDVVFAPRGSRHTFQNIGNTTGHTLTTVVPGGVDIFFEELETIVPRGATPDPARMIPLFKSHALELLGPPLAQRSTMSVAHE
jgi:mannose-6-phosphate isomerase-like protein (cupin superfamily)